MESLPLLTAEGILFRSSFHDEMKLSLYNGSTLVETLQYRNWPDKRWKINDFHRYYYEVDRVEIWFHINENLNNGDFRIFPVRVYGFSFWEIDGDS